MNWLIFKGGKQVDAFPGYSKPIFKHPKEIIKKYDKIHK